MGVCIVACKSGNGIFLPDVLRPDVRLVQEVPVPLKYVYIQVHYMNRNVRIWEISGEEETHAQVGNWQRISNTVTCSSISKCGSRVFPKSSEGLAVEVCGLFGDWRDQQRLLVGSQFTQLRSCGVVGSFISCWSKHWHIRVEYCLAVKNFPTRVVPVHGAMQS